MEPILNLAPTSAYVLYYNIPKQEDVDWNTRIPQGLGIDSNR